MEPDKPRAKLEEAYALLSSVNGLAYRDIFLLSNEVLSKSPFNNQFLRRFLRNERPRRAGPLTAVYKISRYYVKSFIHYLFYLFRFIEYRAVDYSFDDRRRNKELVLIDTVFNMEVIKRKGSFNELFFQGIDGFLNKRDKPYAYLPFFYSTAYYKKPFEIYGVLKILKRGRVPILTEFQLLSVFDLLRILYFIIAYPFHVLIFTRSLCGKGRGTGVLKGELINTLDQVAFYNFSRYLQGKRIAELPCDEIKMISWYENRPLYKNLYKGLRTRGKKVKIYGAQLFLYSKKYLTLVPDEDEERFGIVPDKILANGPYYIPSSSRLNYAVGPSLRYAKIFNTAIRREDQKNILVLLPFMLDEAEDVLRILKESNLKSCQIVIKAHPGIRLERFKNIVPPDAAVSDRDVYELFKAARIVIGAGSGTLIEAASLGIPVIVIKDKDGDGFMNPLPDYGRGKIWDEAMSAVELRQKVSVMDDALNMDPGGMDAIAKEYKKIFFNEPSEEGIVKAFDI